MIKQEAIAWIKQIGNLCFFTEIVWHSKGLWLIAAKHLILNLNRSWPNLGVDLSLKIYPHKSAASLFSLESCRQPDSPWEMLFAADCLQEVLLCPKWIYQAAWELLVLQRSTFFYPSSLWLFVTLYKLPVGYWSWAENPVPGDAVSGGRIGDVK